MSEILIAIDGPAASGKSTTARRVAERLGYCHMNSGLLYRSIAWSGLRDGWIDDPDRFAPELSRLGIALERRPPEFVVEVNGDAPGPFLLAAPETARRASRVAARPEVRNLVLRVLRESGAAGGVTCDGRDIGTVVFPEADLKIFLVASAEERARRRMLEQGRDPSGSEFEDEVLSLRERDLRDSRRTLAPMVPASDALEIDTTEMRPEEVVDRIVALALERGASPVDDSRDPA
ncbi:MAG: (d)CMP kinase [Gemmatimonadota bacterium]